MEEYSGLAIADYFIKKCLEQGKSVTNMSILKMIYFAHGLAYPKLNRKLIKDPFFAWPWGPVERRTYDAFKRYGGNNITATSGENERQIKNIEEDDKLRNFLDALLPLADVDPFVLSNKSHEKGGPWDVTKSYKVIDDKIIEVFFTARYAKR